MKKLNKILAVASTVLFLTCTAGVETQAEVILNEKGVPIELKYSSETPSLGEISQDMQILENYVKKRRSETKLDDQIKSYSICLNRLLRECAEKHRNQIILTRNIAEAEKLLQEYNAKYEDFITIVSAEAANGAVGPCTFWAHYLSSLLSKAKINNHILVLSGGLGAAHAIVIYRITKTAHWMVFTCGYNPAKRKLPSELTLEQYLLGYIETAPTDTEICLNPKSFGEVVNHLRFYKDKPQEFTTEVIDMYIDHLLKEPGKETELTKYIASIKAQKK
ncbi:MAG: hypothetical protein IJC57_02455 [Clostridia bacterium]|nr:hypothetical protein [Clostridia bacterium]